MNKKHILFTTLALVVVVMCSVILVGALKDQSTKLADSEVAASETVETKEAISTTEVTSKMTTEVTTEIVTEETIEITEFLNLTKNYLILIEKESQRASVEAFKAFKESKGFNVFVKSAEEDLPHKEGRDRSLEVEAFLDQLDKDLSLDYVLLIGDPYDKENANPQNTGGVIPMRYLYFYEDNHNTKFHFDWYNYVDPSKSAFNTPSDFTYALKMAWDYDKDGYAGEDVEMNNVMTKETMILKFLLGRIPFSDNQSISQILNHTIEYESTRKAESRALIAAGIVGYPESKEHNLVADGAHYADELSKNMTACQIENTTMFEQSGVMPSTFESTIPLTSKDFKVEMEKGYDMIYTNGQYGSMMMMWSKDGNNNQICDERMSSYDIFETNLNGLSTGFLFFDGCHTISIEKNNENQIRHFQDFMLNGFTSAGIATTRDSVTSPREYPDKVVSNMFVYGSNLYAYEFYQSLITLISKDKNFADAYVNCYMGDPSLEIYP